MPTLHTFWKQKKTTEASEIELYNDAEEEVDEVMEVDKDGEQEEVDEDREQKEVDEDNDTGGILEDEIETNNWHKKIPTALENLVLDIKKENVNSEVWVCLNSIRFYLQLVKYNYKKIEASKVVADTAGKGIYHAKCICSWAHQYVIPRQFLTYAESNTLKHGASSGTKIFFFNILYFYEEIKYNQCIVFPLDYFIPKLHEEAKELRQILNERRLWPEEELKLEE
ncbi:32977_t:CDS:2, partial [Gigaspora margarita]